MRAFIALFALVAVFSVGCGSDPQPSANSVSDKPPVATGATAPVATVASSTAPGPAASGTAAPAAGSGDPAALLEGGAALDALPTRATSPGKKFDAKLRRRLMATPAPLAL